MEEIFIALLDQIDYRRNGTTDSTTSSMSKYDVQIQKEIHLSFPIILEIEQISLAAFLSFVGFERCDRRGNYGK